MSATVIRRWHLIHKWTSLVCTGFLFVTCLTGLPLIFMTEINAAVQPAREPDPAVPREARAVSIDRMISTSRARFPGQSVVRIAFDDDEPVAFITLIPTLPPAPAKSGNDHWLKFDIRTGKVINTTEQFQRDMKAAKSSSVPGAMDAMLRLHVDLFARLPGQLFIGVMGLLFVTAIVSGIVLYGPFTRKLDFGTVRAARSRRTLWLDLHNLLGITTLAWALVVGVTGAMNEVAVPLYQYWVKTDLRTALEPWRGAVPPSQAELSSAQAALDSARKALRGMQVTSMNFPNSSRISQYHYWLWAKGNTHMTARLSTAVLIDARTGKLVQVLEMPWYLQALQISRPLHFGDYGGLPLKILWALLDLVTIVVLGSGLYLWIARPRRERAAAREVLYGASPVMEPAQ